MAIGWFLIKNCRVQESPEIIALKTTKDLPYVAPFRLKEFLTNGKLVLSTAASSGIIPGNHYGDLLIIKCNNPFFETWTQYDPELLDRELIPKDCRKNFYLPKPLKKLTN